MSTRTFLFETTVSLLGLAFAASAEGTAVQQLASAGARQVNSMVTQQPLMAPANGQLFVSLGQVLPALDQPVGSCRLRFDRPGREVAAGTRLRITSVHSSRSGLEDRGISTLRVGFEPRSPIRSLFCDTVGNSGPSWGEVSAETRGVLLVEPADDQGGAE